MPAILPPNVYTHFASLLFCFTIIQSINTKVIHHDDNYNMREGPHHTRPPVFRRGMQGRMRPWVHTCDYPVCQLQGPSTRGAGRRLRCQEGGPPACVGVEIPPHPRREKGAEVPETPEDETPTTQQGTGQEVDTEVEMEVEPAPGGRKCRDGGDQSVVCAFFPLLCFFLSVFSSPLFFPLLCFFLSFVFSFLSFLDLLFRRNWGEGNIGTPPLCRLRAMPGVGNGYTGGKGLYLEGQRQGRCHGPSGRYVAG